MTSIVTNYGIRSYPKFEQIQSLLKEFRNYSAEPVSYDCTRTKTVVWHRYCRLVAADKVETATYGIVAERSQAWNRADWRET